MEDINRIEIQGRVGTVRTNIVNETMVANFSVATDYIYKKDGAMVNETTWHNVVAWASTDMPDLKKVEKGVPVNVIGRMRSTKFTSNEGVDKYFYEIHAQKLKFIREEQADS